MIISKGLPIGEIIISDASDYQEEICNDKSNALFLYKMQYNNNLNF